MVEKVECDVCQKTRTNDCCNDCFVPLHIDCISSHYCVSTRQKPRVDVYGWPVPELELDKSSVNDKVEYVIDLPDTVPDDCDFTITRVGRRLILQKV